MHAAQPSPFPLAGFRDRAAATLIDALLVYGFCRGLESASLRAHAYLPFELTFLVVGLAYSVLGIAWRGATPGKAAVGDEVRTLAHGRVGLARAVLREALGKVVAAVPLGVGFLAAAGPRRRGWHDRLAGTIVVRVRHGSGSRWAVAGGLGAGVLVVGRWLADVVALGLAVSPVVPAEPESSPRLGRARPSPIEVAGVGEAGEGAFLSWLDEHGESPRDLVLEECRRHAVVIVGEQHWQREPLAFLSELLPDLYRSGVRCLAMEWLLAEDDERIEQLVTAQAYDPERAMELARHQPWRTWGWKGYVDVLDSAWRLNASLGPGEAKLRVLGLDLPLDLTSLALAGFGDDAVEAPAWERLRAVRLIHELPGAILRDAFMALQVERHVLERGQRAIVWIGAAHSAVGSRGPGPAGGWGRTGLLLARKHPDLVTQVYLHDAFGAGPPGRATENGISRFVERLMERRGNVPLAWSVTDSPFEALRDSSHWSFAAGASTTLGDVASNYVFLAPRGRITRCEWLAGYVTERMLAEYRPYYEALGRRSGVEIRDAASADLALSRM